MKKVISLLSAAALVLCCFTSCSGNSVIDLIPDSADDTTFIDETTKPTDGMSFDYSALPDKMLASDNKYELAFVTNGGSITDGGVNQSTYEGIKRYAREHKADYTYYVPANETKASENDIIDAIKAAAKGGAAAIVCCTKNMENAVNTCAAMYPNIGFFYIDGNELADSSATFLSNVAYVRFREEQAGFLAGYAAVTDGRNSLGYFGIANADGKKMSRYGYGFFQGADYAAAQLGITVKMRYYYDTSSNELNDTLNSWFTNGTQTVFVSTFSLNDAAIKCAEASNGELILADTDYLGHSNVVLTSAAKSYRDAVMYILQQGYGSFSSVSGKNTYVDAAGGGLYLSIADSRFSAFTNADYVALLSVVSDGTAAVKGEQTEFSTDMFVNLEFIV